MKANAVHKLLRILRFFLGSEGPQKVLNNISQTLIYPNHIALEKQRYESESGIASATQSIFYQFPGLFAALTTLGYYSIINSQI